MGVCRHVRKDCGAPAGQGEARRRYTSSKEGGGWGGGRYPTTRWTDAEGGVAYGGLRGVGEGGAALRGLIRRTMCAVHMWVVGVYFYVYIHLLILDAIAVLLHAPLCSRTTIVKSVYAFMSATRYKPGLVQHKVHKVAHRPSWPTKAAKSGLFPVTEDLFCKKGLRSAGGPKLLKWGRVGPPQARVKSARIAPTSYVYYPPA